MTTEKTVTVKVLRAPAGAPPDWVRQAWIGVQMPARPYPRSKLKDNPAIGHEVRVADAVEALREAGRHSAAQWWTAQALLRRTAAKTLVFTGGDCKVVLVGHAHSAPVTEESASTEKLPF